jgi:PmbA protein
MDVALMEVADGRREGLRSLAEEILGRALRAGATDAEVVAYEAEEFAAEVRLGEVETLKESGSRAIGLRVFNGLRTASTSSSDLTREGLERLVDGAIALAKMTGEDPFAGLPAESEFGQLPGDLGLFFDDVEAMPPAERIEIARRCEAAAMGYDPRIQNSGGGDFDTATTRRVLVNSRGFLGESARSYCGFSTAPIAHDERGRMQRNYWSSSARTTHLLDSPEAVGHIAAQRTLRRLGARPVKTQRVPVVFAPEIAKSILGNIFDAANGDAIFRHATFFDGMLGERVAGENITVVDDGTMVFDREGSHGLVRVGGFGTSAFDGEGLPTRRTVLVERGILRSYVTNSYTARKLGLKSTGNASRGLAGAPGTGAHNFYLEPGTMTPAELLGGIKQGLYVTEVMGFGVNLVTGDYSQGAAGLWIENGELAYPVEEITIAGNLKDMYRNITGIANDLKFRGAAAAPTICVEGMTIAGA